MVHFPSVESTVNCQNRTKKDSIGREIKSIAKYIAKYRISRNQVYAVIPTATVSVKDFNDFSNWTEGKGGKTRPIWTAANRRRMTLLYPVAKKRNPHTERTKPILLGIAGNVTGEGCGPNWRQAVGPRWLTLTSTPCTDCCECMHSTDVTARVLGQSCSSQMCSHSAAGRYIPPQKVLSLIPQLRDWDALNEQFIYFSS